MDLKNKVPLFLPLDFFMLRTPILPFNYFSELFPSTELEISEQDNINKIFNFCSDEVIQEALSIANPSLLDSINNYCNIKKAKKKNNVVRSTSRYLNRMTTRSTPFGLFSGICVGDFSNKTTINLKESNLYRKRTRPDMEWLFNFVSLIQKDFDVVEKLNVKVNNLLYISGSQAKISYLYTCNDELLNNLDSVNSSVNLTNLLSFVLEKTQNFILFKDLAKIIKQEFPGAPIEKINKYLWDLLLNEVLISELRTPIGIDSPFEYLINKLLTINKKYYHYLDFIRKSITKYDEFYIGEGKEAFNIIKEYMSNIVQAKNYLQVDLSISTNDIKINEKVGEKAAETAEILWRISNKSNRLGHLNTYKEAFIEKYGLNAEVFLLELLDEDLGLGVPPTYPGSVIELNTQKDEALDSKNSTVLYEWFIDSITNGKQEIELSNERIKALQEEELNLNEAPLSLELYFNLIAKSQEDIDKGNYKLILGNIPGSDGAGKTFGRFIDMFKEILPEKISEINVKESYLEKGVIIADLIFFPTKVRLANVVIAKSLRNYEISLGTNSSQKKEFSIELKDLVVGYKDNHFYLKSLSLNKEIIPKTNNMLGQNFGSNLYRFLVEIGKQRYRTWGSFDWGHLEQSPFLPRVRYKNIILSSARWVLNTKLTDFKEVNKRNWEELFEQWKLKNKIPQYVYLTEADNKVLLNLENKLHKDELKRTFFRNPENNLVLMECLSIKDSKWLGNQDEYFSSELVFPIIKNTKYIKSLENDSILMPKRKVITNEKRSILPGQDWLYLKLYGMKSREEEFIAEYLKGFCSEAEMQGWCDSSFFIRYIEQGNHIRLRLLSDTLRIQTKLWPELVKWTENLQKKGLLSRMVIDTYYPEIERYGGPSTYHLVEKLFCIDSKLVMELLHLKNSYSLNSDIDVIATTVIIQYLNKLMPDIDEKISFLESLVSYKKYLTEFREKKDLLIENPLLLENIYNQYPKIKGIVDKKYNVINELLNVIDQSEEKHNLYNNRRNIFGSIIHIHLNRMFGTDREQETKILTLSLHTLKYRKQIMKLVKK
ncbi:lantibiotic dehydratase [Priestia flexa]|uniref:lantibiotic dehydratase n=1 Tax=Priestia flexa TaxID=86664 RepID=UPI00248FB43D|nr:lantibiotic dehydratase [Priestia flexa]